MVGYIQEYKGRLANMMYYEFQFRMEDAHTAALMRIFCTI